MRRLKFGLIFLILGLAIAYGFYLIRLTNAGYCFAAEKYLTDEEKIRVALVDLLKKYPPSIVKKLLRPDVSSMSAPKNPIYYHDVDEFLSLNPDCCKVRFHTFAEPEMHPKEMPPFIDILMGTATRVIEVTYLVRFRDEHDAEQSVKTTDYLHITNCGTPAKPWSLY